MERVEVDCGVHKGDLGIAAGGSVVRMTPDEEGEWRATQAAGQARAAAMAAATEQRAADLASVRAQAGGHPDPLVQALARLLGTA